MPRNRRRETDESSSGAVVWSVLSVAFFIALGIGVVVLKAQRRAARNQDNTQVNDNRGGGFNVPAPQPVLPQPVLPQPVIPHPVDPVPPNPQPVIVTPPDPPKPEPKVLKPGVRKTNPEGGFIAKNDYSEYREDGAILVGFEIGLGRVFNTDIISYLRPIWLTAAGEKFGTAYGWTDKPVATVKARAGYAIGGVVIAGGGALEGLAFTFMKRGVKSLLAEDAYVSEWYGEQSRKPSPEGMRSGDGSFVIGIHGKRFDDKRGKNFDESGAIGTVGFFVWVKE